jgi:4-hydroxy-3-polyprenylbenzoate decarboxylase
LTEIQTRLLAESGPAVLFENVVAEGRRALLHASAGQSVRHGRARRLGMEREPRQLREVGESLAFLKQPEPPGGWREAFEMLPCSKRAGHEAENRRDGPAQEVVEQGEAVDLRSLPIQTCWPGEPAPLITWPLVVTRGPGRTREDDFNLGIYACRSSRRTRR